MLRWVFTLSAVLAVCFAQQDIELPSFIQACPRRSPELAACIRTRIAEVLPQVKDGHEGLGITQLEPFIVGDIKTGFDAGLVRSKITVNNIRVFGITDVEVRDLSAEATDDGFKMDVTLQFPQLFADGTYKADTNLGEYQFNSKGAFNLTFTDVTARWETEGELEERDGEKYLRITKFRTTPQIGDMKIHATGLLPDKGLNNAALAFLNQYWRSAFDALLPYTQTTYDRVLINYANKFSLNVPWNRLVADE